jgi:AcrR family transcriptional regulator
VPGPDERLLRTAERLFAQRGLDAVSLREIGVAAGHRNNSAAQYHFGSKQGLLTAIFEYRMRPINARRLEMLAVLERDGRTGDLRALVEAFVLPLAEALRRDSFYARFLAQILGGPGEAPLAALEMDVLEGMRRFLKHADACLGHLIPRLRELRLRLAAGLVIRALADHERSLEGTRVVPAAALVADLVDVVVAMLMAPASPGTRRELKTGARKRA